MNFEYSLSGKWLELLKQTAPRVTRAAVLRKPAIPAGIGQFSVIQAVAPSLGVDVSPIGVHDLGEIERAVAAFARAAERRPDRDNQRISSRFLVIASSRSPPGTSSRSLPISLHGHRRRPRFLRS